ncbi:hypothetical protein F4808DRAFT_431242 [Astrocystis sublimbata]|nr:hypothetical protein F4808DRAFT_431242 [Astrocystis sublimbata]
MLVLGVNTVPSSFSKAYKTTRDILPNMHGSQFFFHPCNLDLRDDDDTPAYGRDSFTALAADRASGIGSPIIPERRPGPTPLVKEMMAHTRVSLAAHQLNEQVKESKTFWRQLRKEYSQEVKSLRQYVGVDVLQQIWRKKVLSKDKRRRGHNEDSQLDIQAMKLESCLNQLDEATQLLATVSLSSGYDNAHDSRQHYFTKMRASGDFVVGLSKRTLKSETACADLLAELTELERFVDPKSPTTFMLYRYDKGISHKITKKNGKEAETENADCPGDEELDNEAVEDHQNWEEGEEHDSQDHHEGDGQVQ